MSEHAESDFDVTGWDQAPYEGPTGGQQLSRATVKKAFRGSLEGESTAELLMCQADPDDATAGAGYVASEVVIGNLGGRSGSFVMQHWGLMGPGMVPLASGHIIPGTGTEELTGITGSMEIAMSPEGDHSIRLEYELPNSND